MVSDRVEQNLAERFSVLECVNGGIIVMSSDGDVVYMNPVARNLFDGDVAEGADASRKTLQEYAEADFKVCTPHGDPVSSNERPMMRAVQGEDYDGVEVVVTRSEREEARMLVFSCASVPGEPELRVITMRDETERWRAERRFRVMFETDPAPSIVARLDDMRVVLANEGMADMTGFEKSELLELTLRDVELFTRETLQTALDALGNGASIHKTRDQLQHASGEQINVLVSGRTIEFEGHTSAVFTFLDITELERARLERDADRDELMHVRSRLAEHREAERIRFARNLHDGVLQNLLALNTQLGLDQGQQQAAGDMQAAERLRRYREDVQESVLELRQMIRGFRPTALRQLGLWASLQGAIPEARLDGPPRISLPHDSEPGLPDEVLTVLYQVALEATRNAIKHAAAEHVRVRLETFEDHVLLSVEDDGAGFEMPQRLSKYVQDDHYGLAAMEEDVTAFGGELTIESAPGEGTRVEVELPVEGPAVGESGGRSRE